MSRLLSPILVISSLLACLCSFARAADDAEYQINPRAYYLYVEGILAEEMQMYDEAGAAYTLALQYHPDSYQLRITLAELYFTVREYEKALAVLEPIKPTTSEVLRIQGVSEVSVGKFDEAKATFLKWLELEPDNTTVYSYLANFYRRTEQVDSVIWAYENLVRMRQGNDRLWRELGRLYIETGNLGGAEEAFEQSLLVDPAETNLFSYVGLGEALTKREQYDSAIVVYKKALELDPDNQIINREVGLLYFQMDSLEAAVPYAEKLVAVNSTNRGDVRRLAILYYAVGKYEESDSLFTALVASGEHNALNFYYLGRLAAIDKDYRRAIVQFTELTRLADTVGQSWLDLGYAYQMNGETDKSIDSYQRGLSKAAGVDDQNQLLFALGTAYEQDDQLQMAVEVFEELIARAPDHSAALNYLGYMLADRGERLDYALKLIERAVTLSPDNAAYLDSYGWAYYRLGKYENALTHLQRAVALDSDPIIFDHLGDAYEATGDRENARVCWQRALELAPDNEEIQKKLQR